MKTRRLLSRLAPLVMALTAATAYGQTTINSANAFAYGANVGWTNWRPSGADGVSVGEFICSGYIWAANVGWISMGNGAPANRIQYANNSATDYGVNYTLDPAQPGFALLRGYAYGANIGWINFETTGNPRISLLTGRLSGYAYSANCGWIRLDAVTGRVQTDSVAMGLDTNGNGIADAWEYLYYGALLGPGGQNADPLGTGRTNLEHYLDGTNPTQADSILRITDFATSGSGTNSLLTWTSNTGRLYTIETTPHLLEPWTVDPTFGEVFAPDAGGRTTRQIAGSPSPQRLFRIRAVRPLP
jgi:hypothetical protein